MAENARPEEKPESEQQVYKYFYSITRSNFNFYM